VHFFYTYMHQFVNAISVKRQRVIATRPTNAVFRAVVDGARAGWSAMCLGPRRRLVSAGACGLRQRA
jgi:hypothetical protein